MTNSSTDKQRRLIEQVSDGHFTQTDSPDGMGNTLGPDVSAERQRAEDAKVKTHDVEADAAEDDVEP